MGPMFLWLQSYHVKCQTAEDEDDIFMCDTCGHYESDSEGAISIALII